MAEEIDHVSLENKEPTEYTPAENAQTELGPTKPEINLVVEIKDETDGKNKTLKNDHKDDNSEVEPSNKSVKSSIKEDKVPSDLIGKEDTQESHKIGALSGDEETDEKQESLEEEEIINKDSEDFKIEDENEKEEANPLDDLTDQQVIELLNDTEAENKHLELENMLFENFLQENDPTSLDGMDEILEYVYRVQREGGSFVSDKASKDRTSISSTTKPKLDSYTSLSSIAEGLGPKINISQKTEMIMRAMEDTQHGLQTFLKKSHIAQRNLKSELEEFSIREVEIKEASEIFEYNVVIQGVDKITQKIPAEKFIRYMEEWLKSAQLQIEKLRLRIATLKVQYKKVSQQLIQRQELGENVHAVDFDQLEIENKHFLKKIEQKNIHLIELKNMNGKANLVLSNHKKYLQSQQEECNKFKAEIEEKGKLIEEAEKEYEKIEEELQTEIEKYEQCKNLKSKYTVPELMEYVRLKGQLHELRKDIKIWIRRKKIQDIALNTCIREMKNLTGETNINPAWFDEAPEFVCSEEDSVGSSGEISTFDM